MFFVYISLGYLLCWLSSLVSNCMVDRANQRNKIAINSPSAHTLGIQMHHQARPNPNNRVRLEFLDAPGHTLDNYGPLFSVVTVPNTSKALDVAAALHEVGHHLDLYPLKKRPEFPRLHHPLNPLEHDLLNVLLAITPVAVGLLWTSWQVGFVLLLVTVLLYLQLLGQEIRAWKLAEEFNADNLNSPIPLPLFQSIRRTCLFTYKFLPNMIWAGVRNTHRLLWKWLGREQGRN